MHLATYLIIITFLWQANIQAFLCSPPIKISVKKSACPQTSQCVIQAILIRSRHRYWMSFILQHILSNRNKIMAKQVPTILTSPSNH